MTQLVRVLQVAMCRHRGIGMNRAKKKKVEVPSLLEVRLLLSGHAPEPSPEPTPIATELQKEGDGLAQTSISSENVKYFKRYYSTYFI